MSDLLLLHGALGASAQLAALAPLLVEHRRVHVLEFEGHGATPADARPARIERLAGQVREHLDSAGELAVLPRTPHPLEQVDLTLLARLIPSD